MKESQLNPQVAALTPADPTLTAYDEDHAVTYVRLIWCWCGRCVGNASATARAQDFPLHHAFSLTYKNAINPRVTNGAITVSAEMRFPRWLVWLWPFSSSGISAVSRSWWLATLIAIVVLNVEDWAGNLCATPLNARSPVGPSRHFAALRNLVAIGA
jgi:hypothetical protein